MADDETVSATEVGTYWASIEADLTDEGHEPTWTASAAAWVVDNAEPLQHVLGHDVVAVVEAMPSERRECWFEAMCTAARAEWARITSSGQGTNT